ncbi:PREDICTED: C5a anaphylatoxin chemotactic receptor 1-like [Nanorana parkeri]|uniref:C5a anaphylatoxin chemotactic receptor 1-like n=1 Tax=Nanorana parkeri TaxID=125878 RepID=UPI00085507BE|nr:PREDICTED: C5a anaphylatoxin chemotactic receptor 1-like [Nanorana parkeri]
MYCIVFVLGVPGNGLVVWVTTFEMKRTVNSIWFLNLAVADLLCCIAAPFSIMVIALGHWPLGLFACKTIPSMLLINMYASVLLLTIISIDRCALVLKPVWCQNKRTVKKAYVACLAIWILAFILSSPAFVFRHTTEKNDGTEACAYVFSSIKDQKQKVENLIAVFRLLMGFVIPFVVITACYGVLMGRVSGRYTQSTKTMKVILIVIVGFFVCWVPYHVAGIFLAVHEKGSELYASFKNLDTIFIALAFVNSCMNPIIYVLAGREFKSKFKRSFRFILKNVLAEDVSQTLDSKKSKSTCETKNTEALV